ncbi:MAG TPA: exodeoxyribonuclease VII large subunit [Candidatus Limnocylindrales bacterium]|jgi:exodeoxyribonuclease VII large subunit|nr:exodeoxyribonuclease VII large subunit [Candidatus Limnocylindrales bacterium]
MARRDLLPGWDEPTPVVTREAAAASLDVPSAPEPVAAPPGTFGLRVLGVSEVARAIREAVRADPRLGDVWVEGEVGRVTVSSAGHAYFTLKDARSTISCVWFSDERARSVFQPQAGLRIVVHGRIDLFEQQGAVQLYVESIQPAGFGDLAIRFEALKARLAAEGLFDQDRKRALPQRPGTIAVITSPTGVVWRDVAKVLTRRWPMTRVVLVACKVQGDDAPESIVRAFGRLDRWITTLEHDGRAGEAPQVTILARGGGSLEDLWSFNDERVVRAVVAHRLPVVCGVGHEVDVTLADFAADVRAPTPSAAAEQVVPDRAEWLASFRRAGERTAAAVRRALEGVRRELAVERRALDRLDPRAQLVADRERVGLLLDRAVRSAAAAMDRRTAELRNADRAVPRPLLEFLATARAELAASASSIAVLNPQATLDRGYAIVRRAADGAVVRGPGDAGTGTRLSLRVAAGELAAEVVE